MDDDVTVDEDEKLVKNNAEFNWVNFKEWCVDGKYYIFNISAVSYLLYSML